MITTLKEAKEVTGGGVTNKNSKMPEYTYDLSAWNCKKGSKLIKIEGSTCQGCYAQKGNYLRYKNGSIGKSHEKHLKSLNNPLWSEGIAFQIKHYKIKFMRFHSSGDLQSYDHLKKIVKVAKLSPKTKFWIPTREIGFINQAKKEGLKIPNNLVFRISAPMKNGKLRNETFKNTSSVITDNKFIGNSWLCPAIKQGGACLNCRKCWDSKVSDIAYPLH
jgi:hypothetical protein|tara:strand:- start:757 stop:1410 length:654 start_codon:yes stop_codon:yes gene_type:complete